MSLAVIDAGVVQYSIGLALHTDDYHVDTVQAARIRYDNHLGATDNLTQTGVGGNGTATADAANHEMDLVSGTGAAGGNARFEVKSGAALSSKFIAVNFLITNIANGTLGNRFSNVGLADDFSNSIPNNMVGFHCDGANDWYIRTANGGVETKTLITALASGNNVTIVVTATAAAFYVNGSRVGVITTNLPVPAIKLGAAVNSSVGTTGSRTLSVNYMNFIQKL